MTISHPHPFPEDAVTLDPELALEKIDSWVDGLVKLAPNLLIALVIFTVFFFLGMLVRKLVHRSATSRGRENLGANLGGLLRWAVVVLGALLSTTIVLPSVRPGDLLAGLGVGSVAIGFAFKDILQNWLAGLLLLFRQPFAIGDLVQVSDFEGLVERIESRATVLRTYDGTQVLIPNGVVYGESVRVLTAYERRRSEYDVGIGYGDDPDEAQRLLRDGVSAVDGVESDPGVEVLVWDLAASWVTLRVRWWTHRDRNRTEVRSRVVRTIQRVLSEAHIDLPYETRVHLFHDQTEETDGDRSRQREGWPTTGRDPRPRFAVERGEVKNGASE